MRKLLVLIMLIGTVFMLESPNYPGGVSMWYVIPFGQGSGMFIDLNKGTQTIYFDLTPRLDLHLNFSSPSQVIPETRTYDPSGFNMYFTK